MKALENLALDVSNQLRLSGGLGPRLRCVWGYYSRYGLARFRGLSREKSRLEALHRLADLGWSRREVAVRLPEGLLFHMDAYSAAFLVPELVFDKAYEKDPAFAPAPGQTIIDVGAHQGLFALRAAAAVGPGGRLVAIEPFPGNMALLRRNARENRLANVTLLETAAADFSGQTRLNVNRLVTGGNSLVFDHSDYEGSVPVQADTLDRILEALGCPAPDLIKIDVEGACLQVLSGAPKALASKPRLIIEVEGGPSEMGNVEALLVSKGYRVLKRGSVLFAQE
ncbi:MAG: FkbM family methyltransferase [Elusimicrobia bacterium]|nr:FkbM family methyltransferase [Elusimicrobiota bacterium]